jgi:methyl-accepting chemotaxis protein
MKIRLKLPLAFAAVLCLVVTAALIGIYDLNRALTTFSTMVQSSNDNEHAVNAIAIAFKGQVQEWKDTLLRGKDPAQLEKYWGAFNKADRHVAEQVRALVAAMPEGEGRSLVEKFGAAHATMSVNYHKGFDAFKAAGFEASAGDAAVKGMDREPSQLLAAAAKSVGETSAAVSAEAAADGRRQTLISIALMLAACIVGLASGVLFGRSISRPLSRAVEMARTVAAGDLATPVVAKGRDEIAELLREMESMRTRLVDVIALVRRNSESVAAASAEIAQGNQALSQRTEEQASALEETAASMEQLGSTVRQNADNASQANQLAQSASTVANKGGQVVGQVVETMKDINARSKKIVDIIGVIDGIAFQTNILALNAAVEAARAGEQGRGFAVVASEVRSLAGRSAEAAKEIKTLIAASVECVEQGSALVDEAGTTMTEVVGSIRRVTDIVGEISAASSEQSSGVTQVGEAVSQMDQATQQNAAMVEESAAAADSLKQQARQLVQAVAVFKLGPDGPQREPGAAPAPVPAPARHDVDHTTRATRPAFGRAAAPAARKVSPAVLPARVAEATTSGTGPDDWESF